MADCPHIHRFKKDAGYPVLSQEEMLAGHQAVQEGMTPYGTCLGCVLDRIAALEQIEVDDRVARALEILAPAISPLLSRWLKLKCPHQIDVGGQCFLHPCNGTAK